MARAIAYQDLSPGNVLVSSSADYDEVRLIDVDNLAVRSTVAEPVVYTPGYGAPEVVSGASGASTLADAHALAVLIFQTLTTMHPFRGDLVLDGPPQFQEEQADRYLVPWIDHPEGPFQRHGPGHRAARGNCSPYGCGSLCQRAFVDGVTDPLGRPSAAEWTAALYAATDQIIELSRVRLELSRPRGGVLLLRPRVGPHVDSALHDVPRPRARRRRRPGGRRQPGRPRASVRQTGGIHRPGYVRRDEDPGPARGGRPGRPRGAGRRDDASSTAP